MLAEQVVCSLIRVESVHRSVPRRSRCGERVVVGDVGREPADERGRVRGLVHLREERRRGLDVGGPAEPAGVSGVEVEPDVALLQGADGVGDELLERRC